MIYLWKDLNSENTDFEHHHYPTHSSGIMQLKNGEARESRTII